MSKAPILHTKFRHQETVEVYSRTFFRSNGIIVASRPTACEGTMETPSTLLIADLSISDFRVVEKFCEGTQTDFLLP